MKQALTLVDVPVLDHLVVAGAVIESMGEKGDIEWTTHPLWARRAADTKGRAR